MADFRRTFRRGSAGSGRGWRRLTSALIGAAAVCTLVGATAACSSSDDSDTGASAVSPSRTDTFPVSITHRYGTTTIDSAPTRVATLGAGDEDILLALGITPTSIAPFLDPQNKTVVTPWNEKYLKGKESDIAVLSNALQDLGGEIPKAIATDPNLIVGVNNEVSKDQYSTLSKVAPTIVRPEQYPDWQVPWKVSTQEIGDSVGMSAPTRTKIADTEARFTEARAQHPEWASQTAAVITNSPDGGVSIYGPGDGRGQMLTNLGFQFPDYLKSTLTGGFYGEISQENLGMLNRLDRVVVVDWEGATDKLKANPAWNNLDIVKRGGVVYADQSVGTAMSVPTVLTIPWVLDRLVGPLADESRENVSANA
ncbi:iron-siderophore ABC transporter substrate-binding protein [Gordonia jinhuaensis]|uniref:Iron siderophore-binding protein n=1 Tax=Gordonia jinhuaensis TaxID=1517702 RepID=A0A916TEB1_9ACTN|nr:ABC transporter substrate-binding protein [Gordonia jinhuaensis]GGB39311.1 iron siderophore-binding protein [Gordonia jinhuaensis]